MQKRLQIENLLDNRPRSSRFSIHNKRIYEFEANQRILIGHHKVKNRDATAWRWVIEEKDRNFTKNIKALIRMTKQAKWKQRLCLECLHLSDKRLGEITRCFKQFYSLKSFYLRILFPQIAERGLSNLAEGLKKFSSLENLELRLLDDSIQSFNTLHNGFKMLTSLKTIALSFHWKITDLEIRNFCKSLKNSRSLQNVTLEFFQWDLITYEGLLRVKRFIQGLKNFKEGKLVFGSYKRVSFSQAVSTIKNFESLGFLQGISLDFYETSSQVSLWLNHLTQGLESFKSFMSLLGAYFKPDGMEPEFCFFEKFLSKLTVLQMLKLEFDYAFILNDCGIKDIFRGLKSLLSLQSADLKFGYCPEFSDERMKDLSQALNSLVKLKDLHLRFFKCQEITNEGLEYLSKGLEGHYSLRNLQLGFLECCKITNKGLRNISRGVENLVYLENIEFDLCKMPKISDSGIQSITQSLKKLFALETATIFSSRNWRIWRSRKERIIQDLRSHLSLQKAYLNFGYDYQLIDVWNDRIQQVREKQLRPSFSYLFVVGFLNCFGKVKSIIRRDSDLDFKEKSELYESVNKVLRFFSLYR